MVERDAPQPDPVKSFFDTVRGTVLSSVPALLALIFVVVAVKVFRASLMETTTTVAIVSTADVVALLKGVILTLLPGFLAGLTAASIWWWAGVLPEYVGGRVERGAARRALLSPQALLAWGLIVMAFFTIWWPVFLILLAPVLSATGALFSQSFRRPGARVTLARDKVATLVLVPAALFLALLVAKFVAGFSWPAFVVGLVPLLVLPESLLLGCWPIPGTAIPLRRTLRVFGLVAAVAFIGFLTLSSNVWLPLRSITLVGKGPALKHGRVPNHVAAYVLSSDKDGASLLLDSPRAVIQVDAAHIRKAMPLCVPKEAGYRYLTTRASQVLGLDQDPHSPYPTCPTKPKHRK